MDAQPVIGATGQIAALLAAIAFLSKVLYAVITAYISRRNGSTDLIQGNAEWWHERTITIVEGVGNTLKPILLQQNEILKSLVTKQEEGNRGIQELVVLERNRGRRG